MILLREISANLHAIMLSLFQVSKRNVIVSQKFSNVKLHSTTYQFLFVILELWTA